MFEAALDLIDRPWAGHREKVRGEWDALVGRVRRASGTVLVRREILASATTDQIDRVMRDRRVPSSTSSTRHGTSDGRSPPSGRSR